MTTEAAGEAPARRRNARGQGRRLREELIDAAGALIAESGDASTLSIRQVGARAGVAATSVYLHFTDLDQLKLAVARRGLAEFGRLRQAAVAGAGTAAEALIAGSVAYVRFAADNPGLYRLMFGGTLAPALNAWGADPEDAGDGSAYAGLVQAIGRCQRDGAASADANPAYLAGLLWPALHGIATLRIDRPTLPLPPVEDVVPETVRRLIRFR
ncbi:TetR/AcrR family transcriptional regulator [Specibacter cremeus]|uniref:TetR/AcrR family transcriptional regulator n=1 Tax=Specibacter cremeus TaxID=1629051 RepID=UPI0013DE4F77|nr:TetR/AcrR family transcriptional regulator [Specibacter cremeus]